MLSIYIAFVIAYLTLYFMGYPIKTLLLNEDLKKYDLYITPWIGLGMIIVTLFPLSLLGVPVQSVCDYLFTIVLFSNIVVYCKYKEPVHCDRNELIVLGVTALLIGTIYGIPLAAKKFEYYAIFFNNADFATYMNMAKAALLVSAKYMKENPFGMSHRAMDLFAFYQQYRGCVFSLAFFSGLFRVDLARIAYLLSAFQMFLNIATFRIFLGKIRYVWITCLLLGALCFNNFYQWLVFCGFLGQTFSIGIVLVIFFLTLYLARSDRVDYRTGVLIVFLLTLNAFNYLEALAYPVIPAVAFSVFAVFFKGDGDKKALWKNIAFVGILYTVLNIPVVIKFFRIIYIINDVIPGWTMNFATFYDIAGLNGAISLPDGRSAIIYLLIPNFIILSILVHQLRKEGLSSRLSVTFFSYFALYLIFAFAYYRHGEKSSYNVYKAAVSLSFIVYILLLRFLDEYLTGFYESFLKQIQKARHQGARFLVSLVKSRGSLAAFLFIVFFTFGIRGSYSVYLKPLSEGRSHGITTEHEALKAFVCNPLYASADFILDSSDGFHQMMAEYYSPLGRAFTVNNFGYSLREMKESFKEGDFYVSNTHPPKIYDVNARLLFTNSIYSVSELEKDSILISGYSPLETRLLNREGRISPSMQVTENEASFQFISLHDRITRFNIDFLLQDQGESSFGLRAFVNGEEVPGQFLTSGLSKIEQSTDSTNLYLASIEIKEMALWEGVNDISFELSVSGDEPELYVDKVRFSNDWPR
ncbi:MAG: hypothetical protein LBL73_08520 [Synergistaceae bacterium]|jgi:hypothetical protein|nr:hypothetical protein [Synergistaceae bacterium]